MFSSSLNSRINKNLTYEKHSYRLNAGVISILFLQEMRDLRL